MWTFKTDVNYFRMEHQKIFFLKTKQYDDLLAAQWLRLAQIEMFRF